MRNIFILIFLFFVCGTWACAEAPVNLRDPFTPVVLGDYFSFQPKTNGGATIESKYRLRLTGIIWDKKDPLAFLVVQRTQRIIRAGAVVGHIEVIGVDKDKVVLKCRGKTSILKVGQEITL